MQAVNSSYVKRRNWLKTLLWGAAGFLMGAVGGAFLGPWFLNAGLVMLRGRGLAFEALTWAAPLGAVVFGVWFAVLWGCNCGTPKTPMERELGAWFAERRKAREQAGKR